MVVLVLNASYEPVSTTSIRRALWLVTSGRCELVERRDDGATFHSAGGAEFPVPSVVRLTRMIRVPRDRVVPYTRAGLRARDQRLCQVAGCHRKGTTIDHLVPRSRGGTSTWQNTVLMCPKHNTAKSNRTLDEAGMHLKRHPIAPAFEVAFLWIGEPAWDPYLNLSPRVVGRQTSSTLPPQIA